MLITIRRLFALLLIPVFIDKLIELRKELENSFAAPMFLQSAIVGASGFLLMVFGIIPWAPAPG